MKDENRANDVLRRIAKKIALSTLVQPCGPPVVPAELAQRHILTGADQAELIAAGWDITSVEIVKGVGGAVAFNTANGERVIMAEIPETPTRTIRVADIREIRTALAGGWATRSGIEVLLKVAGLAAIVISTDTLGVWVSPEQPDNLGARIAGVLGSLGFTAVQPPGHHPAGCALWAHKGDAEMVATACEGVLREGLELSEDVLVQVWLG